MSRERLYNLLPSIYRIREAAVQGEIGREPLRELMAILEQELDVVENDIEQLYENWFIETCEEWVVPYIGDLLKVRRLHPVSAKTESHRAWVANTLGYRRRKGTAAVLEQLTRDVTGWPARVVEFFERLQTTQFMNHIRLNNLYTPDLRDAARLELIGGPFETAAHTADVRRISRGRGKYNISNIGIFLWRLESYRVSKGTARRVGTGIDTYFTFHPLGNDMPLFNRRQPKGDMTHLAVEQNVPGMLRRRAIFKELENRREGQTTAVYFGSQPVFRIYRDGVEISTEDIFICNLEKGPRQVSSGVAVDPETGRLAFSPGNAPRKVQVSYSYGFSGDIGAGPYNRQRSVDKWYPRQKEDITWQVGVTQDSDTLNMAGASGLAVSSLREAVEKWNDYALAPVTANKFGIIVILDSDSYYENLTGSHVIEVPANCNLAIVAKESPRLSMMGQPNVPQPRPGEIVTNEKFPLIAGNISVRGGGTASESIDRGQLICDGLLIAGKITVLSGRLEGLLLNHTTLVPEKGGLKVNSKNDSLTVKLDHSICGAVHLHGTVPELRVLDSIVQSLTGPAIKAAEADLEVQRSTVWGTVDVKSIEAGNSIFRDTVVVERRQKGCLRFCYVPEGSTTPRRYRCQPDFQIVKGVDAAKAASGGSLTAAEAAEVRTQIRSRIVPVFTGMEYGDPGYAQLHRLCPGEISTGAEDGSEMGAFSHLKQPQRRANLLTSLDEYLRLGLEAGIFYVT